MLKLIDNLMEVSQSEKPKISKKDEIKSESGINFENLLKTETNKDEKIENFEINIEV